ncbi:hypothetical protein GUJ93_ZPchr0014g46713 [Zizania palustris]|nr:hypothetical protein GUJ93_ZPchr0014g46713 [Zizania palustris]
MFSLRSAACKIQSLQRLQVSLTEKAWRSLCNTQVARKSYLRPGLSAKGKECDKDRAHTYGTSSSYDINTIDNVPRNSIPSQESMHQHTKSGTPENSTSYLPAGTKSCTRTYPNNYVVQADTIATNQSSFAKTDAYLFKIAPVVDNMCYDDKLVAIDDDEILESIDVDRKVMEHYQAKDTLRGSSQTPLGKCNFFNGFDETDLPLELSVICDHGSKVSQVPIKSSSLL